jgi:uncharacterized protein YkwD
MLRFVASLIAASAVLVLMQVPIAQADAASPRLERGERAIVRAINRERRHAGLRGLRASASLSRAANFHSREMLRSNYFAHPSSNGGAFEARVRTFTRARTIGETLAMLSRCGRGSARTVVSMWMNSPGHRAVLMSASYRRVGVGRRTGRLGGNRACMVTADFASRR